MSKVVQYTIIVGQALSIVRGTQVLLKKPSMAGIYCTESIAKVQLRRVMTAY